MERRAFFHDFTNITNVYRGLVKVSGGQKERKHGKFPWFGFGWKEDTHEWTPISTNEEGPGIETTDGHG